MPNGRTRSGGDWKGKFRCQTGRRHAARPVRMAPDEASGPNPGRRKKKTNLAQTGKKGILDREEFEIPAPENQKEKTGRKRKLIQASMRQRNSTGRVNRALEALSCS